MPRRAFTLLEVTLVAVLVVLLAAMAYPSIEAMYGGVRLTAAADLIRARWADARTHAVEEGRPYRFGVVPDTGRFRVAPDTEEYWPGAPPGTELDADAKPLDVTEELPRGVKFAEGQIVDAEIAGEWTTLVKFLPDGTADKDVEIAFSTGGTAAPLVLKLRALTGSVTAQTQPAGKQP